MLNDTSKAAILIALSFTAANFFTPTEADARPSTKSYTCSGVKNLIAQRGAIVMNHKSSSLYRRFVANRSYCDSHQTTKRFSVPTKSGRCSLKICYDRDLLFDR